MLVCSLLEWVKCLEEASFGESTFMSGLVNVLPHRAGNQQNHPERSRLAKECLSVPYYAVCYLRSLQHCICELLITTVCWPACSRKTNLKHWKKHTALRQGIEQRFNHLPVGITASQPSLCAVRATQACSRLACSVSVSSVALHTC